MGKVMITVLIPAPQPTREQLEELRKQIRERLPEGSLEVQYVEDEPPSKDSRPFRACETPAYLRLPPESDS